MAKFKIKTIASGSLAHQANGCPQKTMDELENNDKKSFSLKDCCLGEAMLEAQGTGKVGENGNLLGEGCISRALESAHGSITVWLSRGPCF